MELVVAELSTPCSKSKRMNTPSQKCREVHPDRVDISIWGRARLFYELVSPRWWIFLSNSSHSHARPQSTTYAVCNRPLHFERTSIPSVPGSWFFCLSFYVHLRWRCRTTSSCSVNKPTKQTEATELKKSVVSRCPSASTCSSSLMKGRHPRTGPPQSIFRPSQCQPLQVNLQSCPHTIQTGESKDSAERWICARAASVSIWTRVCASKSSAHRGGFFINSL